MTSYYESPDESKVLTKDEIRRRYQDTAFVIFKELQSRKESVNYLSFGTSRRTMEYSNYGNQPVIVRRPPGALVSQNSESLSSRVLKVYRKPRESCAVT